MKDPANPSIWHDIGDEKARDKTSQALRETALTVRRRLVEDAKLEEDFRKAQQANAALAGVATNKGPLPPSPKLLSEAAPLVWRGSSVSRYNNRLSSSCCSNLHYLRNFLVLMTTPWILILCGQASISITKRMMSLTLVWSGD